MTSALKKTAKLAMYYAPAAVRERMQAYVERKQAEQAVERMKRVVISKEEITSLVVSLGLGQHDVMLHSSIVNIGRIRAGKEYLSTLLEQQVDTQRNTLLVSALPYSGSTQEYLLGTPVFDVVQSPVAMGTINETLAGRPSALRSLHPTHSVIALGPDAAYYTAEHHCDPTPFGEHSPYYKLIVRQGKVLLFGATLDNMTLVHTVEDLLGDLFPVRVYLKREFCVQCIDGAGAAHSVMTRCHNPAKRIFRDVTRLKAGLIREGIMHVTAAGDAEIAVIDVYPFVTYYLRQLARGRSIYGRHRVTASLKAAVQACLDRLAEQTESANQL